MEKGSGESGELYTEETFCYICFICASVCVIYSHTKPQIKLPTLWSKQWRRKGGGGSPPEKWQKIRGCLGGQEERVKSKGLASEATSNECEDKTLKIQQ